MQALKRKAFWVGVVLSGAGLMACAPPAEVGKGGRCYSLGECKPGLACIDGHCTDDLSSVAGDVPVFESAAASGGAGGAGGAEDAGTAAADDAG